MNLPRNAQILWRRSAKDLCCNSAFYRAISLGGGGWCLPSGRVTLVLQVWGSKCTATFQHFSNRHMISQFQRICLQVQQPWISKSKFCFLPQVPLKYQFETFELECVTEGSLGCIHAKPVHGVFLLSMAQSYRSSSMPGPQERFQLFKCSPGH